MAAGRGLGRDPDTRGPQCGELDGEEGEERAEGIRKWERIGLGGAEGWGCRRDSLEGLESKSFRALHQGGRCRKRHLRPG